MLQIEGSRSLDVPYLGYVETHLRVPEVKAFDNDVLLLIVPDGAYMMCTPIPFGTLHIDMVIKLATKEAHLVNQEDTQIVSQTDSVVKITKDTTMTPFETIKVKSVIRAPNHYNHINVMIDDLPEGQHCKDIAVVQQIQILRPGSNKIPVLL